MLSGGEETLRFERHVTCPACGGSGVVIEHPCDECHGEGRVLRADKITLRIPPGIEDGMALRVPEHLSGAERALYQQLRQLRD